MNKPPERRSVNPSASSGESPPVSSEESKEIGRADRVLLAWSFGRSPALDLGNESEPATLAEFGAAWAWAFEGVASGGSTARASRFLSVVRARAVDLRRTRLQLGISPGSGSSAIVLSVVELWRAIGDVERARVSVPPRRRGDGSAGLVASRRVVL